MSSRTLRSRTAETGRANLALLAGESAHDSPSVDSVGLGSVGDNTEPADLIPPASLDNVEGESSTQTSNSAPSAGQSVELMFERFMAAMQQNNLALQENINSNINSVRADVREEINSVRAELNTNNENLDQFRSEVRNDINSIRADIKAEHEKLLKHCDLRTQELRKEVHAKLDSEARRLTNLVGQARNEFHSELVAAKGQMEEESAKLSNAISTVTRCEQ